MMIFSKIDSETFSMHILRKYWQNLPFRRADLTASASLRPVRGAKHTFTGRRLTPTQPTPGKLGS